MAGKVLESVIEVAFSELLRLYADALEKENSLLFVVGFSMKDEHIQEITFRVAALNPTLTVYIFCYDDVAVKEMQGIISNNGYKLHNVKVVSKSTKIISDLGDAQEKRTTKRRENVADEGKKEEILISASLHNIYTENFQAYIRFLAVRQACSCSSV